ncbi:thiamine phosphate synthase [Marinobacter halodurans]|uniref:Thiamine-phosphate synthase n=1 Tax=Marinobacter halodurans TaxID=2528979 RepID=A0ABY1ZFF4_9GAMM|nr:thiamine phosphate synthase [Marinobacter halodurans]TBW49666.1 thiamine phosphate synthase [Marinobacter halodurans]
MSPRDALRPGLYAITDPDLLPGDRLVPAVEAAIRGGAVLVQYRDKEATETERLARARDLVSLCTDNQVPLLINDDAALAKRVGAAGAHLGQEDGNLAEARSLLGPEAILGKTCHASLELARAARDAGADYLAFGRFFPSMTKPGAPAATPDILQRAQSLGLPLSAIGGVSLENAPLLIANGADLLAVIGGLFGTDDIEARARAFTDLFAKTTEQELS